MSQFCIRFGIDRTAIVPSLDLITTHAFTGGVGFIEGSCALLGLKSFAGTGNDRNGVVAIYARGTFARPRRLVATSTTACSAIEAAVSTMARVEVS